MQALAAETLEYLRREAPPREHVRQREVHVYCEALHDAKTRGKTTTNTRVDAAVIHHCWEAPLVPPPSTCNPRHAPDSEDGEAHGHIEEAVATRARRVPRAVLLLVYVGAAASWGVGDRELTHGDRQRCARVCTARAGVTHTHSATNLAPPDDGPVVATTATVRREQALGPS